jgi:flagellar hook-length control protein FliK
MSQAVAKSPAVAPAKAVHADAGRRHAAAEPPEQSDARDFAVLLVDAQASNLRATSTVLRDSTGAALDAAGQEVSARRERVDQETQSVRDGEKQQRRSTAQPGKSSSDGPAVSERALPERTAPRTESNGLANVTRGATAAPGRGDAAALASGSSRDQAVAKPATAAVPDNPAVVTQGASGGRETPRSAATAPRESANPSPAVPVSTGGAAKSSSVTPAARNAPVEALARMLADRVDGPRSTSQAPVAPADGRPATKPSNPERTPAPARQEASDQTQRGAQEGSAVRKTAFLDLVRRLRLQGHRGESSTTIRLNPPELGRMRVDLRMTDDALRVRLHVSSEEARALVAGRFEDLAAALREHDIRVDRFEVTTLSRDAEAQTDSSARAEDQANAQRDREKTNEPKAEGERRAAVATAANETPVEVVESGRVDVSV